MYNFQYFVHKLNNKDQMKFYLREKIEVQKLNCDLHKNFTQPLSKLEKSSYFALNWLGDLKFDFIVPSEKFSFGPLWTAQENKGKLEWVPLSRKVEEISVRMVWKCIKLLQMKILTWKNGMSIFPKNNENHPRNGWEMKNASKFV